MIRRAGLLVVLLLSLGSVCLAHEVDHAVETTQAVAIRLTYADGTPFSFEAFEVYPEGKDLPSQVGRTDEQGRAVFVPGAAKHWRIKAYTTDGHGADFRFDSPDMNPAASVAAVTNDGPNRASLLLFGVSVLLALFGAYQLWLRGKT